MARRKKGDSFNRTRSDAATAPPVTVAGSPAAGPWYLSRGSLVAAYALLFVAVVAAYVSPARLLGVISLFFTDGLLAILWLACAASLGSFVLGIIGARTGTEQANSPLTPFSATSGEGRGGDSAQPVIRVEMNASNPNPHPNPPPEYRRRGQEPAHAGGGVEQRAASSPAHCALDFVTRAALGLGTFSLLALALGLAGWLNTATVAILLITSACLNPRSKLAAIANLRQQPAAPWFAAPAGWHWLWLVTAPILAMVLTGASLLPGLLWKPDDPHPYDVLEYHLQLPREWFELGRIIPLKHNVFSFFPLNAEMQSLLAMHLRRGPYAGMYLAQFIQSACMILAVVGVYGAVRRLRPMDHAGYAILAAVAMAAVPWTMMLASVAYDESALLLYGTVAMAWVLVALGEPDHRVRHFVVAGLLAGLACGVKYTAVPFLLVGIPCAAFATSLLAKRRRNTSQPVEDAPSPGRAIGCGAVFVAAGLLTFSPWLVKNVAWAKNPIFPLGMRALGHAHFSEAKVKRFEIAHSPTTRQQSFTGHLKAARDELVLHWEYGYVLWPVALVAICLAMRRREVWFLGFLLLAIFITWIGFTHLLSRFFTIALPVAALLIGTLPCRRSLTAGWLAVGAMGLIGWTGLPGLDGGVNRRLLHYCVDLGQLGLFGLDEPGQWLVPDELPERDPAGGVHPAKFEPLLADKELKFALIGNAQPFAYSTLPMSRITYRTVFDVDGEAGYPDAWLPPDERGDRPHRVLVVHPDEVERLAGTYFAVPHLPTPWPVVLERPFLEKK